MSLFGCVGCSGLLNGPAVPRTCTEQTIKDSFTALRGKLQVLPGVTLDDTSEMHCDTDDPLPVAYGVATVPPDLRKIGCRADNAAVTLSLCDSHGYTWYVRIENQEMEVGLDDRLNRPRIDSLQ